MSITLNEGTYQRKRFDVPAMSMYTIDFGSEQPNYFRVNNMSDITLYGATNSLPNKNLYDFKINPASVANFAEPKHSSKLYIFNPHDKDAQCIINYWSGEFDATFMAVSEISLNNEGVVETDGIVKGFTTSLPAGENKIGTVGVDGLTAIHNNIASLVTRGNEIKALQTSIKNNVGDISTAINAITESNSAIAGRDYTQKLSDILTAVQNSGGGSGGSSVDYTEILNQIKNEYLIDIKTAVNEIYSSVDKKGALNALASNATVEGKKGFTVNESIKYIGEIVSPLNDENFMVNFATTSNGEKIETCTIEQWNNICHLVKCKAMQVINSGDATSKLLYMTYYG